MHVHPKDMNRLPLRPSVSAGRLLGTAQEGLEGQTTAYTMWQTPIASESRVQLRCSPPSNGLHGKGQRVDRDPPVEKSNVMSLQGRCRRGPRPTLLRISNEWGGSVPGVLCAPDLQRDLGSKEITTSRLP